MRNFWAVTKLAFKTSIVYRLHFYTTIITVPITLFVYAFLWKAIFAHTGQEIIRGFTYNSLIMYYVISMIVGLFSWSFADEEFENMIRWGSLNSLLLRPVNLLKWQYAYETGVLLLAMAVELIPLVIVSVIFFNLAAPPLFYLIAFLISLALARTLVYLISYSVGLSAFWLKKIKGIRRLRRVIGAFLGGALIPLTFFPESLQSIFHFLPFQYTRYVPANIFLVKYTISKTILYLGLQIVWIFILLLITHLIWRKAVKKYMGVGA